MNEIHMRKCEYAECEAKHHAKGYCRRHYYVVFQALPQKLARASAQAARIAEAGARTHGRNWRRQECGGTVTARLEAGTGREFYRCGKCNEWGYLMLETA